VGSGPRDYPRVLPKLGVHDSEWPPPTTREGQPRANYARELEIWLLTRDTPPPPRAQPDAQPVTWDEEPASGRLPFLIL
jgi:hypothetical protein